MGDAKGNIMKHQRLIRDRFAKWWSDCDEIAHLVQSGRSVGAVAPGGVAVRVESLVALLPVLLLFRSHDVCLHPRAQFRPEHVAHECRLTERRLVENAQVDRGLLSHDYRPPQPAAIALFARTSTARAFHFTMKQDFCNETKLRSISLWIVMRKQHWDTSGEEVWFEHVTNLQKVLGSYQVLFAPHKEL